MAVEKAKNVPPFVLWCTATIPTAFDDSMSYYEAVCALYKWIQDNMVEPINNNATLLEQTIKDMATLKSYVDNYFDNLDVQEEINNKLDDMAEKGELAMIIDQFVNLGVVFTYDTVDAMKEAENLAAGCVVRTLGENTLNDGRGAYYKIDTTGDVELDNGLFASVVDDFGGNNYYDEITVTSGRDTDTDYYVATIPLNDNDGNLIVPYVNDETSSHTRSTIKYAQDEFTTLTLNAGLGYQDSHGTWQQGTVISNGVITHVFESDTPLDPERCSYIGFKADRTVKNYSCETTGESMLADGVKDAFLTFGQVVVNGTNVLDEETWGEAAGYHPLVYIGVKADGTMVILASDGRTNHDRGLTCYAGANKMIALGCLNVWRTDGGGSTSLVWKGSKQNRNIDDNGTKDRGIWVTLNFKKPIIDKELAKVNSFIGAERQLLNKQIRDDMTAYNSSYNAWNVGFGVNTINENEDLAVLNLPSAYRHSTGILGVANEGGTAIDGFQINTVGLVKVTMTATFRNASQSVNVAGARTMRVVEYGTEDMPSTGCMLFTTFRPEETHEYGQISGTVVFNNNTEGKKYSVLIGGKKYDDFYRVNVEFEYIGKAA